MLCTILPEETALVGDSVFGMHHTEVGLSSRSYGTIKVELEVECVQRVNDYIV